MYDVVGWSGEGGDVVLGGVMSVLRGVVVVLLVVGSS